MEKILTPNKKELKEAVARSVARILKEEVKKGTPINEGLLDKIRAAAVKYGIPAAIGIAAMYLGDKYGMSDAEVAQVEQDMKANPDKYFGKTYDNGGLDYDAEHSEATDSINEDIENVGDLSNLLASYGWAFVDAQDVVNKKTGQEGVRFRLEEYPNNLDGNKPISAGELQAALQNELGEKVIFSNGHMASAPEITALSMIVLV